MNKKKCSRCKELKPLIEFNKANRYGDGHRYDCRACDNVAGRASKRTKEGIVTHSYSGQKKRSKDRNYPLPTYSKDELKAWMFSQDEFHKLFDKWVKSAYNKMLKPSCDRLDDYKTYALDNLRLVTWKENKQKGHDDTRNGINNKQSKAVIQMTMEGLLIKEHYSMSQADRETGVPQGNISRGINRRYKSTGGYRWMLSIGVPIHNNGERA